METRSPLLSTDYAAPASMTVKPQEQESDSPTQSQLQSLVISEIYTSIQGESTFSGLPCTFIRLTGCPLRCSWCDTSYAFYNGKQTSLDQVMSEVKKSSVKLVELTGGEPLAQKQSIDLMKRLVDEDFTVLIETSGSISIQDIPPLVHIIMDIKCPDSRMSDQNRWDNISLLKASDEVKFVIASRADFDWAVEITQKFNLENICTVLFSPAFGLIKPEQLVEWILLCGLKIRLNLQIHKFIWHPRKKGV